MNELEDIDRRSELFVGLTPESLARHVAGFERTARTPPAVASLLGEARRTFVGASTCYDNFASSAFKALQAAELARRGAEVETVLNQDQLAWFREFALHFRNQLAHPRESIAMTPGMAEPFVRAAHAVVAGMFPDS